MTENDTVTLSVDLYVSVQWCKCGTTFLRMRTLIYSSCEPYSILSNEWWCVVTLQHSYEIYEHDHVGGYLISHASWTRPWYTTHDGTSMMQHVTDHDFWNVPLMHTRPRHDHEGDDSHRAHRIMSLRTPRYVYRAIVALIKYVSTRSSWPSECWLLLISWHPEWPWHSCSKLQRISLVLVSSKWRAWRSAQYKLASLQTARITADSCSSHGVVIGEAIWNLLKSSSKSNPQEATVNIISAAMPTQ